MWRDINDLTPFSVYVKDSATGLGKTGVTAPTVYYAKPGGASTELAAPTWAELDATNMPGFYRLTPSAGMVDTAGNLAFCVQKTGCIPFNGLVILRPGDAYTRLGAPAGASIAADIATRLATAGYTAPDNATITAIAGYIDTEVAAILAAVDTEVAAIKAKTDTIGSVTVTVVSPVASDGTTLNLVRGDDYANADGRALTFTNTGVAWPSLAGATVTFTVGGVAKTCTVTQATAPNQSLYAELTAANTEALGIGTYDYDVQATLAGGRIDTLIRGKCTLVGDVTRPA